MTASGLGGGFRTWEALDHEVTRDEALAEIARHDAGGALVFLAEVGDRPYYQGREVVEWLGF